MPTFALVDCNNFYASCERLFQPDLRDRPVVVLSNNDGCVIARSNEAKALGIPMGAPLFKIRKLVEEHGVIVRSSNYALYGDISERVMSVLGSQAPAHEIYSIDECFLDLDRMAVADLTDWCRNLRRRTHQWTGIPVSIGVGPTKTLAKVANRLAKKSAKAGGVLDLSRHPQWTEAALRKTAVGDVWGIGRRWNAMLEERGIHTAYDLACAQDGWVRQRLGIEPWPIRFGELPDKGEQGDVRNPAPLAAEIVLRCQPFIQQAKQVQSGSTVADRVRAMSLRVLVTIKVVLERAVVGFDQGAVLALQPTFRIVLAKRSAHDVEALFQNDALIKHQHRNCSLGRCGDQFRRFARQLYLANVAAGSADRQRHAGAHCIGAAPEAVEDRFSHPLRLALSVPSGQSAR